jgi:hypothetical protein
METFIKKATWMGKSILDKHKTMGIVTNVFWQSEDAFIRTDSKFLFKMICAHFFSNPNRKINLTLEGYSGVYLSDAYRLYFYNLMYKQLTGDSIKGDILEQGEGETLFYQVMLDAQLLKHQKRVLRIIQILDIDFKEESKRYGRVLFKTKKKKQFEISDIASLSNLKGIIDKPDNVVSIEDMNNTIKNRSKE